MTLFAKSLLAFGLFASLSAPSANAFPAAMLAAPADVAKAGYQSYYAAPSYGYGGYNSYGSGYGYHQSYSYGSSYGYRQSYGYRPSYGHGYGYGD
jgi:hypothetical protein